MARQGPPTVSGVTLATLPTGATEPDPVSRTGCPEKRVRLRRDSTTIRTARSRNSSGYLRHVFHDITPSFPRNRVSGHAGGVQPSAILYMWWVYSAANVSVKVPPVAEMVRFSPTTEIVPLTPVGSMNVCAPVVPSVIAKM